MWKLNKVAQNEINKGQTTAFKRCANASEAKRFKRTLNELTNLQSSYRTAKGFEEAARVIKDFMLRFPKQTAEGDELDLHHLGAHLPKEKLNEIGQQILDLNPMKIDPQYSLSQIVSRTISNQCVLEDPTAAMKHFREGIERVKLRQETLKKIQESSPDRVDGRTLLVSPIEHQRFYDSY